MYSTDHKSSSDNDPTDVERSLSCYCIGQNIQDFLLDVNWIHVAFKTLALCWTILVIWLSWWTLTSFTTIFIPHSSTGKDDFSQDLSTYFAGFKGHSECAISATELYNPTAFKHNEIHLNQPYCSTRQQLLEALSEGGRIGFDTPYMSKGCQYRWFTPTEICFILDRFDNLVFVGDSFLHTIYNGLMILLRKDLISGAILQEQSDDVSLRQECRCNNQFTQQSCSKIYTKSSKQTDNLHCRRTANAFLKTETPSFSVTLAQEFKRMVPWAPPSNYKPIPIIVSLSPASTSRQEASDFLLKTLELTNASKRNTPVLWIGPTAAGHVEIKGRKGNQEIWDFNDFMAKVAVENDVEVLGMWNMTVQATSWDGIHFGEKVAIVQAMMVVNWLSRLESS